MLRNEFGWTGFFGVALMMGALLACVEGGSNDNQKGVGDQPGGVQLGIGDIAVSPFGNYVLFKRDDRLAVGWIETGAIANLPVEEPTRLAFSKTRRTIYVGSDLADRVFAVDVESQDVLWDAPIFEAATEKMRIAVSKDDRFLVVASSHQVEAFDAQTGQGKGSQLVENGVVDVEMLPDSKRALIVEQHAWNGETPSTRLVLWNLETGGKVEVHVPNCADDIAVSADGKRALLAPTMCQKDPVSVIALAEGAETFERNLPGFGPVELAPDGTTAVAFLDRDAIDPALFDDKTQIPAADSAKYQLMLIDSSSLAYELVEIGDDLPRFALTPDGNVLLVDSSWADTQLRLFDVTSRTFKDIDGPNILLNNFAMSSDSQHVYSLQSALYHLDIPPATSESIGLGFTPQNLNISADDKLLFLRKSESEICIFDLATHACQRSFLTAK